ncbi:MAG TPA: hydantoinase B/oxoprolinase family protein, partial [Actinomycetota bacterium]|nr:hydantoinase B/oxoprolinase family protein [Actinomycetota bacterium]
MSTTIVHPVTFEIIRHRLNQVIEEAIAALENVSGSPVTNEGHDMMVSLYGSDGGLFVGGVGFLHHLTSAAQAVKHIIANFSDDPGIGEDDAYMLNDPYTAALHAPDVYIISPIHFEGTLVGFVANFVHVTDIGAIDPGGFSPNARDTFQEGFVTQGLKIVEGGKPRRDVIETFLRNVRDPQMTALDLKSQLAANHVAKERVRTLYAEYGGATMEVVSHMLLAQAEHLTCERLRELPDGSWRGRQYVDMPGGLYRVELAVTKDDATLTYDFTGTDPQIDLGINCFYWATWGALFAPVFPLLAWDIPWNEGVTRAFRLIAPEGTLVNARRPAPVSIATTGIVQVVNNLSVLAISKMLGATEKYRDRATAVWHGSHVSVNLNGLNADREFFVTNLTDSFAGAGGARATRDGVNIGGEIPNVVSRWANAETQETHTPMMYLYRRPVIDSGGPGKYRGGVSHEYAFRAHGTGSGAISVVMRAKGLAVPMSLGLFGGLPGCTVGVTLHHGVRAESLPASLEAATVEVDQWGTFRLAETDAQYIRFMGGGGYGDPLERDPVLVPDDVALGLVSE